EASFDEYGPDLRPLRRVPTITEPAPVTNAVRRRWDETRSVLSPPDGVLPVYGEEYAAAMPAAYRDIVAGTDGRVWVQDPDRPGVYPLIWTAYAGGAPVARVEV